MRIPVAIVILAAVACAQDISPFEEGSITYTGGTYKDEVFRYLKLAPETVEEGKRYPLVFFLHGAGERGHDNRAQMRHFPEVMAKPDHRKRFPCFVIAPQCRRGRKWVDAAWGAKDSDPMAVQPSHQMAVALQILDRAMKELPIDPSRVYLTGLSMGGYGSWELGMRRPNMFAAVAPICGGGDERRAGLLVDAPLWAWHGDADRAVPVERTRVMINAIRASGGSPRYSELKGVGHNSWGAAYRDPEGLLKWMFKQKRSRPSARTPITEGSGLAALAGKNSPLRRGERIVFLGDSITQAGRRPDGYVTVVRQAISARQGELGVEVINAGISGHKVPDLEKRLERDVLSKKPTVVLIYIGINDVWHKRSGKGTPKDEFDAGLRRIVKRIRDVGGIVVMGTPSVIGEKKNGENQQDADLDAYAAVSRKVAKDMGLVVCDLRRDFIETIASMSDGTKHRGVLTSDGVHLNVSGNELVADRAAAALAEALGRRK